MTARITLEGKVCLVTGGSRGIGEAIARTFAAHGARVVLAARKPEGVAAVADSIAKEHGADRVLGVAAHAGKEEDCARLVAQAVERFGQVDVLVNNAGTNPYFGPMLNIDGGAWDKTFETNLKGYFWCLRDVARRAIDRGAPASVVNIASVAGLMGTPLQGTYAATKAAIISMTKTLAVELGASKIRVNAIAPGFIDTRLASAILKNEDLLEKVVARTPLGRYGVPDEIAGGALYLASDAASFLTGHTLVIDGGLTIG
ncbi:MAG TPA: SDR family oxidoreductase [Polyangiaceae bacterium]|jgi:NAD(P)-dependent dehydrogenase (short-subunit alcohol dehydrogenase family)